MIYLHDKVVINAPLKRDCYNFRHSVPVTFFERQFNIYQIFKVQLNFNKIVLPSSWHYFNTG